MDSDCAAMLHTIINLSFAHSLTVTQLGFSPLLFSLVSIQGQRCLHSHRLRKELLIHFWCRIQLRARLWFVQFSSVLMQLHLGVVIASSLKCFATILLL